MRYRIQEFECEFQSKDFPQLSFQQFEQMVAKVTRDFIEQMSKLNAQFIALQDFSPLQVQTKFFPVAGCMAIRQTYQMDLGSKNHFVRIEASALVAVDESDAKLPGEDPLSDAIAGAGTSAQGRAH